MELPSLQCVDTRALTDLTRARPSTVQFSGGLSATAKLTSGSITPGGGNIHVRSPSPSIPTPLPDECHDPLRIGVIADLTLEQIRQPDRNTRLCTSYGDDRRLPPNPICPLRAPRPSSGRNPARPGSGDRYSCPASVRRMAGNQLLAPGGTDGRRNGRAFRGQNSVEVGLTTAARLSSDSHKLYTYART